MSDITVIPPATREQMIAAAKKILAVLDGEVPVGQRWAVLALAQTLMEYSAGADASPKVPGSSPLHE